MSKINESTVARIAGNIASGRTWEELNKIPDEQIASVCVSVARAIVAETERTEPPPIAPALAGG